MSTATAFSLPAAWLRAVARINIKPRHCGLSTLAPLFRTMLVISCFAGTASAQQAAQDYLPPGEREKLAAQQNQDTGPTASDTADAEQNATADPGRSERTKNPDVAVIIGNKFYQDDSVEDTAYAYRDADAMRQLLIERYEFNPEKIIWLKDTGQAEMRAIFGTRNNIEGRIWRTIDPNGSSRLFVYYSGHGTHDTKLQKPHILPVDTEPADVDMTGYPLEQLYGNLSKLPVQSIFVMLEAGFSGRSQTGMLMERARPVAVSARPPKNLKADNLTVMTAASGEQFANLDDTRRHGLFTSHLLSGLEGKADSDADGAITASELHAYVEERVSEEARQSLDRDQTPRLFGKADFVIGRYAKDVEHTAGTEQAPEALEDAVSAQNEEPAAREDVAAANDPSTSPGPSETAASTPTAETASATTEEPQEDATPPATQADVPDGSDDGRPESQDLTYWNRVKGTENINELRYYLDRFPEGAFRREALRRIVELEKKQAAAQPKEESNEELETEQEQADVTRELQARLKEVGCYVGRVDGIWGPKSRAALRLFSRHADKSVETLEPTPANLEIAEEVERERVCPVQRVKKKRPPRTVDYDDAERYDDGGGEQYSDYESDYEQDRGNQPGQGYDGGGICWSNRGRIVSCDDPRATLR